MKLKTRILLLSALLTIATGVLAWWVAREQAVGIGDDIGAGGTGRGLDQQSGVDHRTNQAHLFQPPLGSLPGLQEGDAHESGSGAVTASPTDRPPPWVTWI